MCIPSTLSGNPRGFRHYPSCWSSCASVSRGVCSSRGSPASLLSCLPQGGEQLGRVPAIRLSGAVWTERSPVREGHRLLSLLPSRLCRPQKLDAADAPLELSRRCSGVLGARRHRIQRAAPVDLTQGHRPWLRSAGALLRGESLVL